MAMPAHHTGSYFEVVQANSPGGKVRALRGIGHASPMMV